MNLELTGMSILAGRVMSIFAAFFAMLALVRALIIFCVFKKVPSILGMLLLGLGFGSGAVYLVVKPQPFPNIVSLFSIVVVIATAYRIVSAIRREETAYAKLVAILKA
jgi:hypothetical protein